MFENKTFRHIVGTLHLKEVFAKMALAVVFCCGIMIAYGTASLIDSRSSWIPLEQHRLELKAAQEESWHAGYLTGIEEAEPMQEGDAFMEGYVAGLIEMDNIYRRHCPDIHNRAGVRFDPSEIERRFSVFAGGSE